MNLQEKKNITNKELFTNWPKILYNLPKSFKNELFTPISCT